VTVRGPSSRSGDSAGQEPGRSGGSEGPGEGRTMSVEPNGDGGGSTPFRAGDEIDEFTLVRELGRGGMGVVWEAEQSSVKRNVALKLLWRMGSPDKKWVRRFQREAEACGRLNHPGIVRIFASGDANGMNYMAHELVGNGYTLADSLEDIRKEKSVPAGYYQNVTQLFVKIADALQHAHDEKVLHRDVKPSNILIAENDEPKVSDFGLARVEGGLELSRTGEFMGTPFYMSPEQAAARRMGLDHRTDVFSLGATLYEALTLVRAFSGETSQEVFHKILTVEPRNLKDVRPDVPKELGVICQKALEKDPDRRYRTMGEFRDDLQRSLSNEPIRAKAPGGFARAVKWGKRHPLVSTGMGVAMFTMALTIGVIDTLSSKTRAQNWSDRATSGLSEAGVIPGLPEGVAIPGLSEAGGDYQQRFRIRSDQRSAVVAHEHWVAGNHQDAIDSFEQIREPEATTDPVGVLAEYSMCLWQMGRRQDARIALEDARLIAAGADGLDRGRLEEAEALIQDE